MCRDSANIVLGSVPTVRKWNPFCSAGEEVHGWKLFLGKASFDSFSARSTMRRWTGVAQSIQIQIPNHSQADEVSTRGVGCRLLSRV